MQGSEKGPGACFPVTQGSVMPETHTHPVRLNSTPSKRKSEQAVSGGEFSFHELSVLCETQRACE